MHNTFQFKMLKCEKKSVLESIKYNVSISGGWGFSHSSLGGVCVLKGG